MQVIDAREDRLVTRARQWVSDLVEKLQSYVSLKFCGFFLILRDFIL